MGMNSGMKFLQ